MDKGDHIREVYAHYGLAIYHAQVLEYGIVLSMTYFSLIPANIGKISSQEHWAKLVDEHIDGHLEKTLGGMIRSLALATSVPLHLKDLLAESLSRRNWLVHSYFRERDAQFVTEAGRDEMIRELEDAQELFKRADLELEAVVAPLRERYGHTEDRLKEYYAEYLKEIGADQP